MILSYFCWCSLTHLWQMWAYISKGIGKGQPVTYHDCHSGGVEVYLYSFLTSALDRGGWPMTHPHHFTSAKMPCIHCVEVWVGLEAGLDRYRQEKISCCHWGLNPRQCVACSQSLYRLFCPGSWLYF